MKKCIKCGIEKSFDFFYTHKKMKDGRLNKCIECTKSDSRNNREKNIEKYREYDNARSMRPDRVAARAEYSKTEKGREAHRRASRGWYEKNKDESRRSRLRWVASNQKKRKVHGVVGYAVKTGLIKSSPCEVCGDQKSHAHHDDYDKPLDVRWLCPLHHAEWHSENGPGLNGDD